MSVLFAILTAMANAVDMTTQHIASTAAPDASKGWRLAGYLLRNPLWLLGGAATLGGFVFQSLALHNGVLAVVQALLMTELVFTLLLRRFWLHQRISRVAWLSAVFTVVATSLFIATAEPTGGNAASTFGAWSSSILACGLAVVVLVLGSLQGSPSRRTALLATAGGITWSLEAAFMKAMTDTLAAHGIGGAFARWPVYAVIVGGVTGAVLTQAALHVGPLRVSQPLLIIVDPLVAIPLSIHLFDEHFSSHGAARLAASAGFVGMCVGVLLLTRTVPETMDGSPGETDGSPGETDGSPRDTGRGPGAPDAGPKATEPAS